MIKLNMILLLMIFLTSAACKRIRPLILCDLDSRDFNRCRCRCYSLNDQKAVNKKLCDDHWERFYEFNEDKFIIEERKYFPKDHPVNLDQRSCDQITGFKLEDVSREILPWARSLSTDK